MREWLVIGGGIHGTHLAHALLRRGGVDPAGLALLDPHQSLLHRWRECTRAVGMRFLRSPVVHHIDVDPYALHRFGGGRTEDFCPPYDRPSLDLFDAHCDAVIRASELDSIHLQGHATGLSTIPGGYRVASTVGALDAKYVVLALGLSEHRHWPGWALSLKKARVWIRHVFEPGFTHHQLPPGTILICGGGVSAGQLAVSLAEQGREVTLWMRHPRRVHQFDSDPGWMGPRYMNGFHAERDLARRRVMITAARHKGSMPPDVADALDGMVRSGRVALASGEVVASTPTPDGLRLRTTTGTITANAAVLCTGFETNRPGGPWIDAAIDALGLPCAACGYPVVGPTLQWGPGLFVMGPLAELELGPTARNITGAREGARRIMAA